MLLHEPFLQQLCVFAIVKITHNSSLSLSKLIFFYSKEKARNSCLLKLCLSS